MSTPGPGEPLVQPRPRVLLVEDDDTASRGLSRFLVVMGYDVQVVPNGAAALKTLSTELAPDFVLTDWRLPDLDGREVALAARKLVPPPRVALMTGWDVGGDLFNPEAWGIDWVLTKPLNVHELVARLRGSAPPPAPSDSGRGGDGTGGAGEAGQGTS